MAYSLVQSKASAGELGFPITTFSTGNTGSAITAGNTLVAFVFFGNTGTLTLSDTVGTNDVWTQCGSTIDLDATYHCRMYRLENAAAGTLNLQCSSDANLSDVGIAVYEFSGLNTSGFDKTTGQPQTNPGTGAGAITSGNTSALASQPQLVIGFCADLNTNGTHTGTGDFTTEPGIWAYGGAAYTGRLIHKRVTATTALAATFTDSTNGSGSTYGTFVATFAEGGGGGGGSPIMGQICL